MRQSRTRGCEGAGLGNAPAYSALFCNYEVVEVAANRSSRSMRRKSSGPMHPSRRLTVGLLLWSRTTRHLCQMRQRVSPSTLRVLLSFRTRPTRCVLRCGWQVCWVWPIDRGVPSANGRTVGSGELSRYSGRLVDF